MSSRGFTLIELVMIIVLIAILGAYVVPKLGNVPATNAGAFVNKLRADLRYAQNLAMTTGRRHRVYVNTAPAPGSGYLVVNDANGNTTWGEAGEVAMDPAGGGNLRVTLNAGQFTGITVSTPAGGYIEFNSLGAPTGGAVTLTVFGNAVAAGTVTVTAQTGAVN
jgi:prepilin-type N-terminal cleavage/methylation domain-containing protein